MYVCVCLGLLNCVKLLPHCLFFEISKYKVYIMDKTFLSFNRFKCIDISRPSFKQEFERFGCFFYYYYIYNN